MKFPRVAGESLDGERHVLPRDLPGDPTLALFSFRWEQRSLVEPWCGLAATLADRCGGFEFVELLVVDERSGLFRPSVGGGMGAGLLPKHRHGNMLVLRVDKSRFQRSLGLLGEETIYALLVDDDQVVRQSAGALTRRTAEAVESLVEEWEACRRPVEAAADGGGTLDADSDADERRSDPTPDADSDGEFDWLSFG